MAHPTKATKHPSRNRRRNNRGLTTLEWLLIVAAVAGLAALAVVLVQNVVDETAEQISGSSARLTAALVAAQEITDDTISGDADSISEQKAKCERLQITYGDAFDDSTPVKAAIWVPADGRGAYEGKTPNPTTKKDTCRILDKGTETAASP